MLERHVRGVSIGNLFSYFQLLLCTVIANYKLEYSSASYLLSTKLPRSVSRPKPDYFKFFPRSVRFQMYVDTPNVLRSQTELFALQFGIMRYHLI